MSWPNFPIEIERNHETFSQQIPSRDWKMSGTARHNWLCYLYISFFLTFILQLMCLFSTKMEIWDLRAQCQNVHRPGHVLRSAVTLICRPVWWIRFIKTSSCRDDHARNMGDAQATRFCDPYLHTNGQNSCDSKLLRIKIKQLYCIEALVAVRPIAL